MDQNFDIIEPLDYYKNYLKDKFEENVKNYFNKLVDESGINIEENQKLVEDYKEASRSRGFVERKLKKFKFARIAVIIAEVFLALLMFGDSSSLILAVVFLAGLLYLHFGILNKKIKEVQEIIDNYNVYIQNIQNECYASMRDLNVLFTSEMTNNLIKNLVPLLNLDDNFDIKRFEQLVKSYGFIKSRDNNYSTLNLVSGDILGNPFVFIKYLLHQIVDYKYTGRRTISYIEYYRDSDGNRRSRRVTETLTATVTKPGPKYYNKIDLVYGNEAAPNLSFYRTPKSKSLTNNVLNKLFDKDRKKLRKLEKNAVMEGGSFQAMANEDFDIKFAAYDRDNEAQFRLLFTALGQENMMKFLDNDVYGDDLYFNKENMINTIYCTHTDDWDIDNDAGGYTDFDFVSCKNKFAEKNKKYFQDMYYTFAPLLSIPLYQQHKSLEYIYGDSYSYNYNSYTTEMIANAMDISALDPKGAKTNTILKTKTLKSKGDTDLIEVDAFSYDTETRIDVVNVRAGDGNYYAVEVPWTLYIPISRSSIMEVTNPDIDESKYNKYKYDQNFDTTMRNFSKGYAYKQRLFGTITNMNDIAYDDQIKNLFKN